MSEVQEVAKPSAELPVQQGMVIVGPAVSNAVATQAWKEYQELERAILIESDYIYYVLFKEGKWDKQAAFTTRAKADSFAAQVNGSVAARKKKVAFRKLALFFGLTLPKELGEEEPNITVQSLDGKFIKIEKRKGSTGTIYMDSSFKVMRAEWTVTVQQVRQDGKVFTQMGYGECSNNDELTKIAHNIVATAYTRALNRAISDLVGFGEVSAEEVSAPQDLETVIDGQYRKMDGVDVAKEAGASATQIDTLSGEKLDKLRKVAIAHHYNIAQINVESGLVHLVNTEKFRFAMLNNAEGNLLYQYIMNQGNLTGKDLDEAKTFGKQVLQKALADKLSWKEAFARLKPAVPSDEPKPEEKPEEPKPIPENKPTDPALESV